MPCMELRSTFIPCFFLFLILALPYFPRGRSQVLDPETYEIDYRGPETHSSVPPPHSHAKNSLPPPKPTRHREEKMKKIRG